jgi:hypothetical protein
MATINATEADYNRFCRALTLSPSCATMQKNMRTTSFKTLHKIWEKEEPKYQKLCQAIKDVDLQMDGTFSQRRHAEHGLVTLLSNENHFIALSVVGSRKELHKSSQGLELELSTRAVVAIAVSPLHPTSITHDEHAAVTLMLESHMPAGCCQFHDGWHRLRNLGKYLPPLLEKAGLSKPEADDLARKVMMLLNSAYHTCSGDVAKFLDALDTIPGSFPSESTGVRETIKTFLSKNFPRDSARKYIGKTNTSALEGFHGHHHQFVVKARFVQFYRERTSVHNLIWNAARLRDFLKRNPTTTALPSDILQGDDWIRAGQKALGLVVLSVDDKKMKNKNTNTKKTAPKKQANKEVIFDTETINMWTE